MKKDSYRREHKRLYWRVTIRWQTPDLDGNPGEPESTVYRFPGSWTEQDAYEAAAMRWDESRDWGESEHARACEHYRATAKLVRTCDTHLTQ